MKITESKLNQLISECISKRLNTKSGKRVMNSIIKESFEYNPFHQYESNDDVDGRESDEKHEDSKQSSLRKNVIRFFKNPGVDHAYYAYKLYGIKQEKGKDTNDMKNARSKFEKCLNGEPNENGYPYSFSSSEINYLQSLISNQK